jgi:hypothetical protein
MLVVPAFPVAIIYFLGRHRAVRQSLRDCCLCSWGGVGFKKKREKGRVCGPVVPGNGLWFMVYGSWFTVIGLWFMVGYAFVMRVHIGRNALAPGFLAVHSWPIQGFVMSLLVRVIPPCF